MIEVTEAQLNQFWESLSPHHKRKLSYAGHPHRWCSLSSPFQENTFVYIKRLTKAEREVRGMMVARKYLEQGRKCFYTGLSVTLRNLSVDHVRDLSDAPVNLRISHHIVNKVKGDKSHSDFLKYLESRGGVEYILKKVSTACSYKAMERKLLTITLGSREYLEIKETLKGKEHKILRAYTGCKTTIGMWPIKRGTRRYNLSQIRLVEGNLSELLLNDFELYAQKDRVLRSISNLDYLLIGKFRCLSKRTYDMRKPIIEFIRKISIYDLLKLHTT